MSVIGEQRKRGRFLLNIITNIVNFFLSILIGLWFTPYLIKHLGVASYGMLPLILQITSYLQIVTLAINAMVARNITIAIEQGEDVKANIYFNTSLFSSIGMVIVLCAPAWLLCTHANLLIHVPPGMEQDISLLFLLAFGMFALSTLSTPFEVASYCLNRFDLRNYIQIAGNVTRIGLVVLLFMLAHPDVKQVFFASLVASIVTFALVIYLWRYLLPELSIRLHLFAWSALQELFSSGMWMVITQVGTLLFLAIDLLVVNRVLGPKPAGEYGAIMQWSALLRGIAGVLVGVFGPSITNLYAHGNIPGLVTYTRQSVRFVGYLIALPIGLICGLAHPLLVTWLGPSFGHLAPLLQLMTIHLAVNLALQPIFLVFVATNTVRTPGIVSCVMGVMNLGLAFLLAGPAEWGMYGVAAAGAIMLTLKNAIFTPLYGAHVLQVPRLTFMREMLLIVGAAIAVTVICLYLDRLVGKDSWRSLLTIGSLVSVAYLIVCWISLSREDRQRIEQMMPIVRQLKVG
ncbi:MAG: lipopolysaccharide biosynthesis protein [Armatimonadota bacterium]